ncbi:hypothetical protein [Streptomyces longwoodensis]|uniref:hypothetical protein n=1 Tax=Streptomyces longwoodensis TaxID=68231 RepID=UPI001FE1F99D|nr:hypothetical protein [Streptomyces longwoodensis]
MTVIDRETEVALDLTRGRFGRTVHPGAAAAARAHHDKAAVEAYTNHLAPHAEALLDAARLVLDELPPARHLAGSRAVLDGLAASAAEIRRALDRPAAPGSAAERAQHSALWPYLAAWADHSFIATDLADQSGGQHKAPLTDEEERIWTERAQAAQRRGELELTESWYAADGQPITLAHLIQDNDSTLVALRGDPDAPGWQVIGHYAHEYEAGKVLPAPVPPGVLRADVSRFNRPALAPEVSLQELIRDVVEGQTAGDASEALLGAVQRGYDAGPMIRLQELLETSSQFAAPWRPCRAARSPLASQRWAVRSSSSPAKSKKRPRTSARPSPSCPHTAPPRCAPARAPPWTPHPPPPPRASTTTRHR